MKNSVPVDSQFFASACLYVPEVSHSSAKNNNRAAGFKSRFNLHFFFANDHPLHPLLDLVVQVDLVLHVQPVVLEEAPEQFFLLCINFKDVFNSGVFFSGPQGLPGMPSLVKIFHPFMLHQKYNSPLKYYRSCQTPQMLPQKSRKVYFAKFS